MMERINNVRISDLMGLLYNLSKRYEAIDIIIDAKNKRIVLDPIPFKDNDTPTEDIKLTDSIILDLI
jgi:hypothetical protein